MGVSDCSDLGCAMHTQQRERATRLKGSWLSPNTVAAVGCDKVSLGSCEQCSELQFSIVFWVAHSAFPHVHPASL